MANLQAVDQQSTGTVSPIGSQVESVVFQRVVGSFGGSIEFGRDTVPDDYDHDGAEVESVADWRAAHGFGDVVDVGAEE